MNAQNVDNKPKVKKNTKRKIRVDFERAPLKERLKAKFLSLFFIKKIVWFLFRLILLIGISYIVLFPFFSKIAGSFMSPDDFVDATVRLIPKNFSVDIYTAIWEEKDYMTAFSNTLFLSLLVAVLQTFSCCLISYGLAKFKFKGNGLIFMAVILTLAIPHQTLYLSISQKFLDFDIFGIFQFLNGGGIDFINDIPKTLREKALLNEEIIVQIEQIIKNTFQSIDIIPSSTNPTDMWSIFQDGKGVMLKNSYWPFVLLSLTGLAFKNGLYIFMLRQFFRGVPDELEESAYIDGSGIMRTFFTIIIPLSVPMMITVFLFSFSWQWTDNFYTGLFFTSTSNTWLMPNLLTTPPTSLQTNFGDHPGWNFYSAAISNTAGMMIIAPLIVMYLFCQRYLVQGIERSGLTAD